LRSWRSATKLPPPGFDEATNHVDLDRDAELLDYRGVKAMIVLRVETLNDSGDRVTRSTNPPESELPSSSEPHERFMERV
jgi:hypothetical protein